MSNRQHGCGAMVPYRMLHLARGWLAPVPKLCCFTRLLLADFSHHARFALAIFPRELIDVPASADEAHRQFRALAILSMLVTLGSSVGAAALVDASTLRRLSRLANEALELLGGDGGGSRLFLRQVTSPCVSWLDSPNPFRFGAESPYDSLE